MCIENQTSQRQLDGKYRVIADYMTDQHNPPAVFVDRQLGKVVVLVRKGQSAPSKFNFDKDVVVVWQ